MENQRFYSVQKKATIILNMCGGCADWWDYVLEFHVGADGEIEYEDYTLYTRDADGLHLTAGILVGDLCNEVVKHIPEGVDYDLEDGECLFDYESF